VLESAVGLHMSPKTQHIIRKPFIRFQFRNIGKHPIISFKKLFYVLLYYQKSRSFF
jgi:hypothetical protein